MKWSYSSWSLFKQCPKKYKALRIDKLYKQENTQALTYGKDAHKAAELYIRDGIPVSPAFAYMKDILDVLKNLEGEKHCELELGLTKELTPCDFNDPAVWWRGIADFVIKNGDVIHLIDYKSGANSRYADKAQLEILSLALFKHFPETNKVKAGLLFTVADDFIKETYHRSDTETLWLKWIVNIEEMEETEKHGRYNPKPNFTCRKYCPVTTCPHCGG